MPIATTARAQTAAPDASLMRGVGYGLAAVVMWAGYLSFARAGIRIGLAPQDIVFLRFAPAAALTLPWLIRFRHASLLRIGVPRSILLALTAGPLFIILGATGYTFAPLAHGAVVQPATVTLAAMAIAWLFLGERLTAGRALGIGVIIVGLVLIASGDPGETGEATWVGDLLFAAAGLCWAVFTVLLKRWNVGGLAATAIVSVLSGALVVPSFIALDSFERLAAIGIGTLLVQILVQGVCAGFLAVVAYGRAVDALGASRAALFPALVPAVALVIGIPITGELPTSMELVGAVLATFGLTVAIGVLRVRLPGGR
ncbi:DMT family transporter [Acuticoccus mangrovi]|uniref:DMT family transporter n=1 Tax=Acuticoccus mangrovi TaxID=2796142 RepID=A0A934MF14_9HYPH|nr:DMT family transporter [Acuticoccus mangrovi]MBJ3778167.1 DMT family transporter [Acuticoccus mangrovi]